STTWRQCRRPAASPTSRSPDDTKHLVDGHLGGGGAGGNRTPVHQAVTARATTIPEWRAHAAPPPGRLTSRGGPRIVFPIGQRSFPPPACFQAVILRFCCRAAVDRPRAALRLTMCLYLPEIRRRVRTAGFR